MHEQEAVALLRRHNKWRRGADVDEMIDPRLLGIAIDTACEALARLVDATAYARRLAVIMHRDHYAHESPVFEPLDDLIGLLNQIDNMMTGWPPYYAAPVQPAAVAAVPDEYVLVPTTWFDREIPRLDAGGPNPITPDEHCCEWVLYQERERIHAAVAGLLAATPAPVAPKVPEGFVLVPKEPTGGMTMAGVRAAMAHPRTSVYRIYRAMLAAAQQQKGEK